MTKIPATLDKLSAPIGDPAEMTWAFNEMKRLHPSTKLTYVGFADGLHWFQEWGNTQPFTVAARPTFTPKFS